MNQELLSMKNLLACAPFLLLVLMASPLSAVDKDGKDPVAPPAPSYDTSTVIKVAATVTAVREVAKDKALDGLHLILQSGSETLDVYIGPDDFVKVFDETFVKGDKIEVIGSKIVFEGSTVVLARQVVRGTVTLLLRDEAGKPLWKYFVKPPVG
jgi:hypothetical protein